MEKITLEADNGALVQLNPETNADWVIEQLEKDGVVHFRESVVWDYIDSSNKFFRLCPESDEAMGRAIYNQIVYDILRRSYGRL